jgi:hypothetical protein
LQRGDADPSATTLSQLKQVDAIAVEVDRRALLASCPLVLPEMTAERRHTRTLSDAREARNPRWRKRFRVEKRDGVAENQGLGVSGFC